MNNMLICFLAVHTQVNANKSFGTKNNPSARGILVHAVRSMPCDINPVEKQLTKKMFGTSMGHTYASMCACARRCSLGLNTEVNYFRKTSIAGYKTNQLFEGWNYVGSWIARHFSQFMRLILPYINVD